MSEYKILDYIKFPIESTHQDMMTSCFVVYSTKEEHVPNVIGVIEDVFKEDRSYQVVLLGEQVKSGDSQYGQLIDYLNLSSFAIVILDGFRPNVLFEFGVLKGLKKPCIVLLEKCACVDVASYYTETKGKKPDNPKIDIDKHFSDVKDRYYVLYDRNNHKELRKILEEQHDKLKSDIEKSVLSALFPGLEAIEDELKHCILSVINYSMNKSSANIDELDLNIFVERIDRLATKHKFQLSDKYYKNLAGVYRRLKKYDNALKYIDKALSINQSDISSYVTKAFLYANLHDENSAILTIDDAIKKKPEEEFLWHNKGLLFERFDKKDEAQICYEKAIEYDNTCSKLHYHYASILYEKKQFNLALDNINTALCLEQYNDMYLVLKSMIYEKLEKPTEALKAVKNAISFNTNNADAWYQLGDLTENTTDKIKYYNKCLDINPKHHAALCSKGSALSNTGQFPEALEAWKALDDLCDKVSDCATLLLNIGTTKYFQMKSDGTSKLGATELIDLYFNKAINTAEDDEKCRCYNNIGYIQLQAGHYSEAKSSLNNAIALAKREEPVTLYNLAIAHTQLNELEEAISLLKNLKIKLEVSNCHSGCLLTLEPSSDKLFITREVFGDVNLLLEVSKSIEMLEHYIDSREINVQPVS